MASATTDAVADPAPLGVPEAWERAASDFTRGDDGRSVLVEAAGVSHGVGSQEPRPGASIFKIPVVLAVYEAARAGSLDLDATVTTADLPASPDLSLLNVLAPDHRFTIAELCGITLAVSENRVADHLLGLVGFEPVNRLLAAIGCRHTHLVAGLSHDDLETRPRANLTTVEDCVRLLHHVDRAPDREPIIRALESVLFCTRIPLRLPDDTVIAHKTGSLSDVVNDIGIIRTPRGDLFAAFLCDRQPDPAETCIDIGDCMSAVWTAWTPEVAPDGR